MCGRYTLSTPGERLAEVFGVEESLELEPRFNIAPTQMAPVVVAGTESTTPVMRGLRWGLVPHWADDPAIGNRMINARAETIDQKPAYRDSFRHHRCLVPADGFYEWKKIGTHKQPFFFSRGNGEPFAIAGIWARWTRGSEPLESYALITTEANTRVAAVHHRMPVLLEEADWGAWLNAEGSAVTALKELLCPAAADVLQSYAVSTFVNSPANDSSRCVEALLREEQPEPPGPDPSDPDTQTRLY